MGKVKEQIIKEMELQNKALQEDQSYFENSEDWLIRTTGQLPTNESIAR